jgi:hypothetical protein
MDLIRYKSTEGVHDAIRSLSLVQRPVRGGVRVKGSSVDLESKFLQQETVLYKEP